MGETLYRTLVFAADADAAAAVVVVVLMYSLDLFFLVLCFTFSLFSSERSPRYLPSAVSLAFIFDTPSHCNFLACPTSSSNTPRLCDLVSR